MYREWAAFRSWYFRVMAELFRLQFLRTFTVVLTIAAARITGFLALVLPLKVILLAGSDGVPRYFRFFIEPETKSDWVVGLALASILLYVTTLVLEICARRLIHRVSVVLLDGGSGNALAATANEEDDAQSYYARFCRITANSLFISIAMIALLLINPTLFSGIAIALIAEWLISSFSLSRSRRIGEYIRDKLRTFLGILGSINFLFGFLIILAPFVLSQGASILVALVSVLLLRQLLGMTSESISTAVGLSSQKSSINAMLFREHDEGSQGGSDTADMHTLFSEAERETLVRAQLGELVAGRPLGTIWQDPGFKHFRSFLIRTVEDSGRRRLLQCQIYPAGRSHMLRNEEILFGMIPRAALWAPDLHATFSHGPFRCQIVEYGEGVIGRLWTQWVGRLQEDLWSISPPADLISAFARSQPLLHDRLNERQLQKLGIALASPAEHVLYEQCIARLPDIRRRLQAIPLCLQNRNISRKRVQIAADGKSPLIPSWGSWKLEPMGAAPLPGFDLGNLGGLLESLKGRRTDVSNGLQTSDLMLAYGCWNLDQNIRKERFRAAIGDLQRIMQVFNGNAPDRVTS